VHPSVVLEPLRDRHRALIGLLLVGPFLLSAATAQTLVPVLGMAVGFALLCVLLASSWLALVLLSITGDDDAPGVAALALSVLFIAPVVAAAGGATSPLVVLALAPAIEAWWLRRSRASFLAGGGALVSILLSQALMPSLTGLTPVPPSVWHWLVPAAYGVMVAARFSARPAVAEDPSREDVDLMGLFDVVTLRMARSGDVADVSSTAREMFGLAPELLLNNGLFDRVHLADRIAYLSAVADMRAGAERRRCEVRVRLPHRGEKGQGPHHTHGLFAIDFRQAQDAEHLLAAIRDIGDVATLRAELAAARDAGVGGEAAKAKFLAVVSHELRTPLNAIIGFSDMLLHGLCGALDDPKQREYVGLIQESGTHLLSVVNAILDVSKIESGTYDVRPEPFDFAEAVEVCHSMLALQAHEKGVTIETRLADDMGVIVADRRSVRQILINLIANAVKFTPQGGRVTVASHRAGGRLHFSVGDTGIGMSETDLLRVGEPFMQVQNDLTRQFDGTGLGLSLVKGLVKLHRGTMTIESAPESGTTVSISLPINGPAATEQPGGDIISIRTIQERSDKDGTFRKIA
jgi:cell cycle sensor histidine kinase DivJ